MEYEETHPWITFRPTAINQVDPRTWMLAGEARSKCEHLAGAPLKPAVHRSLYEITLIRGALATVAIEGNTLTEEQVRGIRQGTFKAPPSRQYQEREVRNVLTALDDIHDRIVSGEKIVLTRDLICEFNGRVLDGLELDPDVVAGAIRTHSVLVGGYRGAPWQDCDYLLDRLAGWLEEEWLSDDTDGEIAFAVIMAKAVLAHLYLAWIHPFGDSNGRTARLVEFVILARSGVVPLPAAHLLSNHYNLTRDRYYHELARASASGGDPLVFLQYAIQGFVDGIREVIETVQFQQVLVAWTDFINEVLRTQPTSKATERQRVLVRSLPMDRPVRRADIRGLTPEVAALYAPAGPRTLARDLNHLEALGLIRRPHPGMIMAAADRVNNMKPLVAPMQLELPTTY
jgi:Fic family protein